MEVIPRGKSPARRKSEVAWYAVRDTDPAKCCVVKDYSDALNFAYQKKGGYGNACKFYPLPNESEEDCYKRAEAWTKKHVQAEGSFGDFRNKVKERHPVFQGLIVAFTATVFVFIIFHTTIYFRELLKCNTMLMTGHPVCAGLLKIETTITSNLQEFYSVFFAKCSLGLIWLFSELTSWLTK